MQITINRLFRNIDELIDADLKRIDWAFKASPEKWSKKEIIGHLIDSAQVNLQRFVRCTYEENFKLTYEQVEWVNANCYQTAEMPDLIALWELLNLQIIRVWQNYPPDRLQAMCDNSKKEITLHTVEFLAQDYVDHLEHHLNQIYTQ